ncbi:MAG: DUF6457 domain-containing protein [Acidimicrobiales bacterium]|nr:hypothetical protein [Actinomycetota bacterium]
MASTDGGEAAAVERTGREWIAAFAAQLGVEPPDEATVDQLLELAGVAAHASERIAAPIACWLVGRAGLDAADALERSRRT